MIKRAALIGLGTMGPGIAARLSRGVLDCPWRNIIRRHIE
ncbi:3-hydroxyacyl-CoA dehydrogenase family protein, partial [Mesorhizobium sp. M7A.F.Ca.CA.004.01.1.1]